jgi:Zn-dependent peptidase ImmA (M78 family)
MRDKHFSVKINPQLLIWARESVRFAPAYVAQELNITENELKELETGIHNPTYEQLLQFSKLYEKPIGAFLLNEVPKEKNLPKDFRTARSEKLSELHDKTLLTIRRVRGLVEDAIELRTEMGVQLPEWKFFSSMQEDPEAIAGVYRKNFNVEKIGKIENTNDALDYLISQFENKGILVFQTSLTQDEVRGFSLTDEAVPVIVLRRGDRPTAKTFTLFHEFGHILLHEGGICNLKEYGAAAQIEKWCNQFAASVLVPLNDLLAEEIVRLQQQEGNKYWQLATLKTLGDKRHVGPEVILRSLYNANLTTRQFYEEKHEKWNSATQGGRGGGKPRDFIKEQVKEKGKTFTRLAWEALNKQRISLKDFSDYMDVKIDQVHKVPAYL